jgi:hypothetical protein
MMNRTDGNASAGGWWPIIMPSIIFARLRAASAKSLALMLGSYVDRSSRAFLFAFSFCSTIYATHTVLTDAFRVGSKEEK